MVDPAKEYGTALFALACEENKRAAYAAALGQVKAVFESEPAYIELLASPSIPLAERLGAIETAFSGKVPEYLLSYLLLLCEKGRMSCFFDAAEAFFALNDAAERISSALVTSAAPLTEEEKRRLVKRLEAIQKGAVRMEYRVDPSLLGGLVVEMDGKVIDGSLRHRLQEAKEVMKT